MKWFAKGETEVLAQFLSTMVFKYADYDFLTWREFFQQEGPNPFGKLAKRKFPETRRQCCERHFSCALASR